MPKKVEVKHLIYQTSQLPSYDGDGINPHPFVLWPYQGVGGDDALDIGLNAAQRIGNDIYIKSMVANFALFANGDTDTNYLIRMIVFQWLDEDELSDESALVYPSYSDILCYSGDDYAYIDLLNPTTSQKYSIMMDKTWSVCNASQKGAQYYRCGFNPPVRNIKFYDNSQGGFDAAIEKGNIFYMVMSNGADTSDTLPVIQWNFMLSYTDS